MEFEWDEGKRRANLAKHGVDFASAEIFEWASAQETEDGRKYYGERRWIALGMIGDRLHVLIYTRRVGRIRLISLRKPSDKEISKHEHEIPTKHT